MSRPASVLGCGCILHEGELHYCAIGSAHRAVALPVALCPHDVQDIARLACARCGTTNERLHGRLTIHLPASKETT